MSARARGGLVLGAFVTALLAAAPACTIISIQEAEHLSYQRRIAAGHEHLPEHEAACRAGRVDACLAASTLHATGAARDMDKAVEYARAACAGDEKTCEKAEALDALRFDLVSDARACRREHDRFRCARAGMGKLDGRGTAPDAEEANALLTLACDGSGVIQGVAEVCAEFAVRLLIGDGLAPDPARGLALLEAQAAAATPVSSSSGSVMHSATIYAAVADELGLAGHARDVERATGVYRSACPDYKNAPEPNGRITRDPSSSAPHLPFACWRLGLIRLPSDPRGAAQSLAHACIGTDLFVVRASCRRAAELFIRHGYRFDANADFFYPTSPNIGGIGLARSLSERGCEAGAPDACHMLEIAQAELDAYAL